MALDHADAVRMARHAADRLRVLGMDESEAMRIFRTFNAGAEALARGGDLSRRAHAQYKRGRSY